MGGLKQLFAVCSVLLLLVLAVSPVKDYLSEWRAYQNDYNTLLASQPGRHPTEDIRIRQIWNPDLGVVDRCTSCHLGLGTDLQNAEQPFTRHPDVYHDIEDLGCTTCHEGQGHATTVEDAHGGTEFWDRPLLPAEYVESACGSCHADAAPTGAEILAEGRKLIGEAGCAGCHTLGQIEDTSFAPSLDGIGAKVSRVWLVDWLRDPKAFRPETRMPDFGLSAEEANLLADFLMEQRTYADGAELAPLPRELQQDELDEDLIELGNTRIREARCISCHAIEGKGGRIAGDLVKVASKAKPEWIYTFLEDPKGLMPGVQMPRYGFTKEDRTAVTAFILSEWIDWDAEEVSRSQTDSSEDPDAYAKGLAVYKHYNCGGCHTLTGVDAVGEPGPDLARIGSRPLYRIDFGDTHIPKTLPSFLETKMDSPRSFPGSRMPDYGFDEHERRAVVTALLAMKEGKVPDAYRPPPVVRSDYDPQGRFGEIVDRYACFSCHTIEGRGNFLASDLTRQGSATNREWVESYFRVPYSMRPVLTERMPNLFMADDEIETVADYFDLVLRDDGLDDFVADLSPANITKGKGLFYESYGCNACHQVGGQGGYVGPPLDRSHERLKAGWVYGWLKDSRRYMPHTIEPRYAMSEDELQALTAYIVSLGSEP